MRFGYAHEESFVHRLDPRIKMLWFVSVTLVMVTWQDPIWMLVLYLSVVAFAMAAGMSPLQTLKGLVPALPMILVVIILNLAMLKAPGKPVFLGYLVPSLGGKGPWIPLYLDTLVFSAGTVIRLFVVLSSTMVLLRVTDPTEMALGIVKLGLPVEVGMAVSIAMAYIPVLISQITEVLEAQQSRGWKVTTGNPIKRIKAYLPVFVPTFFRSYVASEEMAAAMLARGFGYNISKRTELRPLILRSPDKIVGAICGVFLVIGVTLGLLGRANYQFTLGILRGALHI
ncbi:MAG: energy-coupling factor transporter transmembrane protein EcfT [Actinobacteria bacterium]|nr:energy-coupling factor transporter transmembrane protein EcfT [Actinomycetota bacterium]